MRNDDFSNRYQTLFTLSPDISTRDRDGVNKTFSGMMKLLFPADNATEAEVEEILRLAVEGRKRVKDQLLRIDSTYPETDFSFTARDGRKISVTTLEETEYPHCYHKRAGSCEEATSSSDEASDTSATPVVSAPQRRAEKAEPISPREGQKFSAKTRRV